MQGLLDSFKNEMKGDVKSLEMKVETCFKAEGVEKKDLQQPVCKHGGGLQK